MGAVHYGRWWATYDTVGLKENQNIPPALRALADESDVLLASPLPRALATAELLAPGRTPIVDPLFREAPLPPPPVPVLRLKPKTWGVVARGFWFLGHAAGQESRSEARWRAHEAVARLEEATAGGDVFLCAHGYFNWMMDKVLRKRRWRRVEFRGANSYWSYRVYTPKDGAGQ
jgi:broad specificity phosphatase PhoE